MKNVPKETSPLQCCALDITSANRVCFFFQSAHSSAPVLGQGLGGSLAESRTQASLEVALMIHMTINFAGRCRQAMARAIGEIHETRAAPEVR